MLRDATASIERLSNDPRVDIASLEVKLNRISDYRQQDVPHRASDLEAELRVAAFLLDLPNLGRLLFGENPDIRVEIDTEKGGFEVRRIRGRAKDDVDEKRLEQACQNGRLVEYGNPAEFQRVVEDIIRDKAKKAPSAPNQFLFLLSDSRHQIEDTEMTGAVEKILIENAIANRKTRQANSPGQEFAFGAIFCAWAPYKDTVDCFPAEWNRVTHTFQDSIQRHSMIRWGLP